MVEPIARVVLSIFTDEQVADIRVCIMPDGRMVRYFPPGAFSKETTILGFSLSPPKISEEYPVHKLVECQEPEEEEREIVLQKVQKAVAYAGHPENYPAHYLAFSR